MSQGRTVEIGQTLSGQLAQPGNAQTLSAQSLLSWSYRDVAAAKLKGFLEELGL